MPRIIPIFIMNRGCPNRCIFCNERITAGDHPSHYAEEDFLRIIRNYLGDGTEGIKRKSALIGQERDQVQIAFYGGNFTGLPVADQMHLLDMAAPLIEKGWVDHIRISTRPDDIHPEHMDLLKKHHVHTVEIGAQSLVDDVLEASRRGHTAAHVSSAVKTLQGQGFKTGLHLMAGLPGDNHERFTATVEAAIALAPDMVRIHPTLVFRDTPLAEAFYRGEYMPLTMKEALESCKYALNRFTEAGIPVIRLGLQATPEMEQPGALVAGPFHPAFGSLVESSLFLDRASTLLSSRSTANQWATFHVPKRKESVFRGERNQNIQTLIDRFHLAGITVSYDDSFHVSIDSNSKSMMISRQRGRGDTGVHDSYVEEPMTTPKQIVR